MATQVHALAFKATVDNSQLKKGMTATRSEFSQAKKITDQYKTSTDKLNDEFWRLDGLLHKGLISEKQFADQLRKANKDINAQAAAVKKLARENTILGRVRKAASSTAGRVAGGAAAGIAGYVGVGAVVRGAKEQINAVDDLLNQAQKLNIPIESLSRLAFVALRAGEMTTEETGQSLQKMSRVISDAAQGLGKGQKTLEQLNLSAIDLNNLPIEAKFLAVTQAIRGLNNEADQLTAVEKIFGPSGSGLVNLLRMSNEEIAGLIAKSDQLGVTIRQVDAEALSKAADQWEDAGLRWESSMRKVAVATAPLAEFLGHMAESGTSVGKAFSGEKNLFQVLEDEAFERMGGKAVRTGNFANTSEAELDRLLAERFPSGAGGRATGGGVVRDITAEELAAALKANTAAIEESNRIASGGSTTMEPRTITD